MRNLDFYHKPGLSTMKELFICGGNVINQVIPFSAMNLRWKLYLKGFGHTLALIQF